MTSAAARLSPDFRLALAYAKGELLTPFETLLRFDTELGAAVAAASEPLLGQVRLAWWREALSEGPGSARVPLAAALAMLGRHDVIRAELTAMVNGWETLLSPFPLSRGTLAEYANGRGAGLLQAAARVANAPCADVERAGAGWALTDFAFHCSDPETAALALAMGRERLTELPQPGRTMRPFAMLARFARSDARRGESGAQTPARLLDVLRVVLTGR